MVTCNAGCKLTRVDTITSFLHGIGSSNLSWDAIFVPELNSQLYESNPHELVLPGVRIHMASMTRLI